MSYNQCGIVIYTAALVKLRYTENMGRNTGVASSSIVGSIHDCNYYARFARICLSVIDRSPVKSIPARVTRGLNRGREEMK